jgi:uncharacterized Tic20 family protein
MSEPPLPPGPPPPPYSGGAAPLGYANNDEKTWALVAHFGGAAGAFLGYGGGGWIAPLIAMIAKGNESPTIRAHAVAALNFQITMTIAAFVGWVFTCFGGFVISLIAMILGVVFGILGGLKANEGQFYNYPMSLKLVK